MSSRMLNRPVIGLLSGLVLGLLACQASATEEIVVYGTMPAVFTEPAQIKADMHENVEVLNERLKLSIENDLKQLATPKLQLASGETASRG